MSHYQLLRITSSGDQNISWRLPNIRYKHCDLIYAKLNSNWYNVEATDAFKIYILSDAVVYNYAPTPGQYDIITFATMLQALIRADIPSISVEYDIDLNRIVFSSSLNPLEIYTGTGDSMLRILGLASVPTALSLSIVPDYPPNLSLGDVIVNINGLSQGQSVDSSGVNQCFTMVIPAGIVNTNTVYDQLTYTMKINRSAFDINIINQYGLSMVGINLDLMLSYGHD